MIDSCATVVIYSGGCMAGSSVVPHHCQIVTVKLPKNIRIGFIFEGANFTVGVHGDVPFIFIYINGALYWC